MTANPPGDRPHEPAAPSPSAPPTPMGTSAPNHDDPVKTG